ncbi:tripartite tricarboxylate transporter substrate binding protein [Siccirubricoccus sp. G192]|uniref:Bug family tripartite tricarboxylate transporter substrate binding protein n=1 Tax=Siccirubricoccus sp. G192 TaxID=2849651 RepID=UPI001C2C6628|nr:tripartite tricarboxylate transporter substrate binding protein [Siccirubricoccus sp. G192]MBV1798975.1 tripartite tricarboxylate transporter substrate binding protein [Siccirubricoccus sp. G192]
MPFPPGGGVDLTARLLAEPLARDIGQPVVIENRGGAGGVIGVEAMARSPADGYTLSLTGAGTVTAGPHLRRLPYDPAALRHVTRLVRMPFIIAVRNDLPAATLAEFMALGRRQEIRWASGGIGTSQHLAGELFKQMSGLSMVHVPYRGTGPALNDLAARIVDAYFGDPATLGLIQNGQARAIAVTSPERWRLLPETAAAAEAVPGYQAENWYGLAAPPATPEEVVQFLSAHIRKVMAEPEVARRFEDAGLQPATLGLGEYNDYLRHDSETWGRVVRTGNIRVDSD